MSAQTSVTISTSDHPITFHSDVSVEINVESEVDLKLVYSVELKFTSESGQIIKVDQIKLIDARSKDLFEFF